MSPPTSSIERFIFPSSSSKIRRCQTFRASFAGASSRSSTPTAPATRTSDRATRWITSLTVPSSRMDEPRSKRGLWAPASVRQGAAPRPDRLRPVDDIDARTVEDAQHQRDDQPRHEYHHRQPDERPHGMFTERLDDALPRGSPLDLHVHPPEFLHHPPFLSPYSRNHGWTRVVTAGHGGLKMKLPFRSRYTYPHPPKHPRLVLCTRPS